MSQADNTYSCVLMVPALSDCVPAHGQYLRISISYTVQSHMRTSKPSNHVTTNFTYTSTHSHSASDIYIYIYIHTHTHKHTHKHTHTHTHTHIHTYIHIHIHIHIHVLGVPESRNLGKSLSIPMQERTLLPVLVSVGLCQFVSVCISLCQLT